MHALPVRLRLAVFLAAAMLSGCQGAGGFGRGFRDEGLRQAAELGAEAVERRLGDDFAAISAGLREIPARLPAPRSSAEDGLLYGLGGLAAYILGSFGKGMIRSKLNGNGGGPRKT